MTAEADGGIDGRGAVSDAGMSWNMEPAGQKPVGFHEDAIVHDLAVDDHPEIPEVSASFELPHLTEADLPLDILEVMRQDVELMPRYIVGDDNRKPVSSTKAWPYSSVVKLYIYWYEDDTAHGECTGSLIAPDAVLTAAHCVFNLKEGLGSAYKITVVPGEYQGKGTEAMEPFGAGSGKKLFYPRDYVRLVDSWYHKIPYDYAVIRLKSPFKKTGVRSYGAMPDPLNEKALVAAYHGDIEDTKRMMISGDKVRRVFDNGTFNHYIDLDVGSSGGGITGDGEWRDVIFGIVSIGVKLSSGSTYNIGNLITETKLANIQSWATQSL